jgi:hypothetical protein
MRIFIFISLLLIFTISCAQQAGTKYFFPEVGWTITVPADFKNMDSSANAALNAKGQKTIEESNNMKVDVSQTKTFFSAIKAPHNYYSATITAYDPAKDGDFNVAVQSLKEVTYKTFKSQMPDAKIDSSTSAATIDGLVFDKHLITITTDGKVLFNMVMLLKYYKGYDFTISYLYMDEGTKGEIESSLNNSKFAK